MNTENETNDRIRANERSRSMFVIERRTHMHVSSSKSCTLGQTADVSHRRQHVSVCACVVCTTATRMRFTKSQKIKHKISTWGRQNRKLRRLKLHFVAQKWAGAFLFVHGQRAWSPMIDVIPYTKHYRFTPHHWAFRLALFFFVPCTIAFHLFRMRAKKKTSCFAFEQPVARTN